MQRPLLILLLALCSAISCTRQEMPGGALRIVFETGSVETKTDGPDGVVSDGGGIYLTNEGTEEDPSYKPDIIILVANASSGAIEGVFNGLAASNTGSSLEGTPTSTGMSVSFSGLTGSATYTVYAFANTQGLWTMKSGDDTISSLSAALSAVPITNAAQIEALQFQPAAEELDDAGCPTVKNGRLPLSAKGSVTLTALGNGEVSLSLLRCVAKVTAVFENQYGEDLTLYGFNNTFFHMRPQTGYAVRHDEDLPVAHDSPADGDLSADRDSFPISYNELSPQLSRESITWYVFPSDGPYTCDISFYMDSERTEVNRHGYSNLPVHDDHAENIQQLSRNQHLTITTRIGKGKQVSFNFEVADWDDKTETVRFD